MAEEETFKVTDRRGRAADSESSSAAAPRPESTPDAPEEPAPATRPGAPSRLDLQALFMMFASSALVNLGVAADPVTGERRMDMEQARGAIDALVLLREKTAGNRTEDESRFLEQVVYDLQMRYVRIASPGNSRPAGA